MWNLKLSKNNIQYVQLWNLPGLSQVYHKQKAELSIFNFSALGWLKFWAIINNIFLLCSIISHLKLQSFSCSWDVDWALRVFKFFFKRNFLVKTKSMYSHAKSTNKKEKNRTDLARVPNWTDFLLGFNCLAVASQEQNPGSHHSASIREFVTKTLSSPSRLYGMFAHLLCQQKVYHPIRKDSCICNKPKAFDRPDNYISLLPSPVNDLLF